MTVNKSVDMVLTRKTKTPVRLDRLAGAVAVFPGDSKDGKILPLSGSNRQYSRIWALGTTRGTQTSTSGLPRGPFQAAGRSKQGSPNGEAKSSKVACTSKAGLAPMSKDSVRDREPLGALRLCETSTNEQTKKKERTSVLPENEGLQRTEQNPSFHGLSYVPGLS